jgi:hypothetical protein
MGAKNGENRTLGCQGKVQELIGAKVFTTNVIGCCKGKSSEGGC